MTGEVDSDGHVAAARQGQRKGLHPLLRPGDTVGDQHHRRRAGRPQRPEQGGRRRAHALHRDADALPRAFNPPDTAGDGQQGGAAPRCPTTNAAAAPGQQLGSVQTDAGRGAGDDARGTCDSAGDGGGLQDSSSLAWPAERLLRWRNLQRQRSFSLSRARAFASYSDSDTPETLSAFSAPQCLQMMIDRQD